MKQKNLMSDWNCAERVERAGNFLGQLHGKMRATQRELPSHFMDGTKTWVPREIHAYLVIEFY